VLNPYFDTGQGPKGRVSKRKSGHGDVNDVRLISARMPYHTPEVSLCP
jgi:hypothetical protein